MAILVTENFLRLGFTPKPGITPGTDYIRIMDCDQIKSRYLTEVTGISNTGTRLPSQDQVINWVSVGDSHQGGIVAYVFVSGDTGYVSGECHGIIASVADLSNAQWGCQSILISGADGVNIGTGYQNSLDINAGCSTVGIAAKLCLAYSNGGYSDWFLPSAYELNKLYLSWAIIGGFSFDYYWSSTEIDSGNAYAITFLDGAFAYISKSTADRVRAVRYF